MPESLTPASAPLVVAAITSLTRVTVGPFTHPDSANESAPDQPRTVLRFAHLSDPHLSNLGELRLRTLRGKRVLGYLSWRRRRRHIHQPLVLDAVTRDAIADHPDHIAVTGDLTQIGLASEHDAARIWLDELASAATVSIAPGNHDLYASDSAQSMYHRWSNYLPAADAWPRVTRCGDVHFISLCSGAPSEPFFATGMLGDEQIAATDAALAASQGAVRVVLIHHSPHPDSHPPRKQLKDRGALNEVLAARGAELILHGHAHRAALRYLTAGRYRIPVLGAPSASVASNAADRAGGYHRIAIERIDGRLLARIATRRWLDRTMVTSWTTTLPLAGAH